MAQTSKFKSFILNLNFYLNFINRYRMFALLNQELRFDVDLSTWGCGLNAALYFVAMPEDGGESIGYAGPSSFNS